MQASGSKLFLGLMLLAVAQPCFSQQPAGTVHFRFAFGALTGSGDARKLVRIAEDTQLKTGDKLKLMVEAEQPNFVYVLHRSPQNEIDVLFPSDLKQSVQVGRKYYMPAGTTWFELDNKAGNETFYLLGSTKRLTELETLLDRYVKAPASGKAAITNDIVAEIRQLRTQNLETTAPAERPVMIGGNVRSLDTTPSSALPDVGSVAVEITAKDFYARTFTIDHR